MDVWLTQDEISLEPDVPTDLVVDVVNTSDVIDAVQIDLTGAPGAVLHLDSTPTLFPGERRRLPMRMRLPAQMPAGRHHLAVRVRPSVAETYKQAALTVEVGPRPAMSAAVQPSVRRAGRRTSFPLTVANRGNTELLVQPHLVEVPDGVQVRFEPNEFTVQPWQTGRCLIRVRGPRNLVGAVLEHPLDLRVSGWSSTPGRPLLRQELRHALKLTHRQKAVFSTWLLFGIALVIMLLIWVGLGYLGLTKFVSSTASPLELAPALARVERLDGSGTWDVGLTLHGTVTSGVDGSPVAGVTVLACDALDPDLRPRRVQMKGKEQVFMPTCVRVVKDRRLTRQEAGAVEQDVSAADGTWWIENLLPGKYWLYFDSPHGLDLVTPSYWYTYSCNVFRGMPGKLGVYDLKVSKAVSAQDDNLKVRVSATRSLASQEPPADPQGPTQPQSDPPAQNPGPVEETLSTCPNAQSPRMPPGAVNTTRKEIPAVRVPRLPVGESRAAPVVFSVPRSDGGPSGNPDDVPQDDGKGRAPEDGNDQEDETVTEDTATAVRRSDGTADATLRLDHLPAPARYDLTIRFGKDVMVLPNVQVLPGRGIGVVRVPFSPAAGGARIGTGVGGGSGDR